MVHFVTKDFEVTPLVGDYYEEPVKKAKEVPKKKKEERVPRRRL